MIGSVIISISFLRQPRLIRQGGKAEIYLKAVFWIPAYAGMTRISLFINIWTQLIVSNVI